jgi:hypothetical protein
MLAETKNTLKTKILNFPLETDAPGERSNKPSMSSTTLFSFCFYIATGKFLYHKSISPHSYNKNFKFSL